MGNVYAFKKVSQLISTCFLLMIFSNNIQAQCLGTTTINENVALLPGDCIYTVCVEKLSNDASVLVFNFPVPVTVNGHDFVAGDVICQSYTGTCGSVLTVEVDGYLDIGGTLPCGSTSATLFTQLNVELMHFSAHAEKTDVMLEWITENESGNDYFEIEHSVDGRTFKSIDKVDGAGTIEQASVYRYMHKFPVNGYNYYRLKQVDFDGTENFSPMTLIELDFKDVINIFPTAVENSVNVKLFEPVSQDIPVQIFNASGALVGTFQINKGDNNLEVDTSDLQAGIYFMKVKIHGIGVISQSFVKNTY